MSAVPAKMTVKEGKRDRDVPISSPGSGPSTPASHLETKDEKEKKDRKELAAAATPPSVSRPPVMAPASISYSPAYYPPLPSVSGAFAPSPSATVTQPLSGPATFTPALLRASDFFASQLSARPPASAPLTAPGSASREPEASRSLSGAGSVPVPGLGRSESSYVPQASEFFKSFYPDRRSETVTSVAPAKPSVPEEPIVADDPRTVLMRKNVYVEMVKISKKYFCEDKKKREESKKVEEVQTALMLEGRALGKLRDIKNEATADDVSLVTSVEVTDMNCLDTAAMMMYQGLKPLVLCMADGSDLGEGAREGRDTAEASIFRRSNISLAVNEGTYNTLKVGNYLYLPQVQVFKASETHKYRNYSVSVEVDMLVTAPYPKGDEEFTKKTETLIRGVLRKAAERDGRRQTHDCVILGALGCDKNFKHDPEEIAKIFQKVLNEDEFSSVFKVIVFAVDKSPRNYNVFYNALNNFYEKPKPAPTASAAAHRSAAASAARFD